MRVLVVVWLSVFMSISPFTIFRKVVFFNPFRPYVFSHPYQMDETISNLRVVGLYFSFLFKFLFANSGGPDQTPRLAASDLVLHCLPISQT